MQSVATKWAECLKVQAFLFRLTKYVGQDITLICYMSAIPAPIMVIDKVGGLSTDDRRKIFTQLPEDNPENKYAVGLTISDLKVCDHF